MNRNIKSANTFTKTLGVYIVIFISQTRSHQQINGPFVKVGNNSNLLYFILN